MQRIAVRLTCSFIKCPHFAKLVVDPVCVCVCVCVKYNVSDTIVPLHIPLHLFCYYVEKITRYSRSTGEISNIVLLWLNGSSSSVYSHSRRERCLFTVLIFNSQMMLQFKTNYLRK